MDNMLIDMLYSSIEGAINDTVDSAGYNRTIQATIVKCADATIGKYQCKYQDSSFYAYSEDANTTYPDGSSVYILIPNNNLNGDKRIIGSVKKLGLNYINEAEEENFYDKNGNSCIDSKDEIFGLKSYKKEDNLLLYNKAENIDIIGVDIINAEQYLKESTSLMIEATVQTKLDKVQQFRGNYGIRFLLDFENNSDGSIITKEFCLDVDKLSGNPYKLIKPTRQYAIFDIDYGKFEAINKIELYSKDFPNIDEKKSEDIFFSNIKLFGANRMSQSEINGCSLSFIIPQGSFFNENNKEIDKIVQAQVKVKGKVVDPKIQEVEFYWYREDVRTTLNSEYYNSLGGRGWRCLNPKTIVKAASANEKDVVEWIPLGDTYTIEYKDAIARENKFKCVIKYDNQTFYKEFVIKNMSGGIFSSSIESDNGQIFYYDVGKLNLTCVTVNPDNSKDENNLGLQYAWAIVDDDGFMTFLPETIDDNEELENKRIELQNINDAIKDGTAYQKANQEIIDELSKDIALYEAKQRVDGKYLYSVDLTQINKRATFKCSIYDSNDVFLGTSSIVIQNIKDQTQQAHLVINNGSQIFKYDENGIAPTNKSLENPITLKALSYTIFDEEGNEVDFDVASKCSSRWKVPIKRTMISTVDMDGEEAAPDSNLEYQYYKNATLMTYKIADKFDYNKDLNNIELTVDYKGTKLYASTNFTFTKQGDIGTNGTDYVCRIELNTNDSSVKLPIISIDKGNTSNIANGRLNFDPIGENNVISNTIKKKLFKASLYENGEKVDIQESNISWKILQNKYTSTVTDESYYEIDSDGLISINATNLKNITFPANLIQCQISYNGMNFYDVIPILTCFNLETNYSIDLKENSGFKYALYSSDGRNPKYNDDDPFEIIVNKKINNIYENISLVEGENSVSFNWSTAGQVKRKIETNWESVLLSSADILSLKEKKTYAGDSVKKNQKYGVPPAECDGECLTHCIFVNVTDKDSNIVGILHLPIYLFLNRYGIASINQWDGSSVQINEKGGYILAPQIGAGKKDNKNRFTGVLMGEVREANRSTSDIGLLGYSEGEKTFFIDAEDGTTMLGKKANGRMTIDPSSDKALIYSDNFWKYYTEKGKPTNYNETNENGAGMLIDLTTPEIKFGKKTSAGNYAFRIDENGAVTSTSGQIGGFDITDTSIQHNKTAYDDNKTGIYLGSNGTVGLGKNKFTVNSEGYMKAVSGKIAAFNFDDKKMYSDGKSSASSTSGGIFIDTDSSGKDADIKFRLGSNFYVTKNGTLTAKAGTLGNFTLTTEKLCSNDKGYQDSKNGIYISGVDGRIQVGPYDSKYSSTMFEVTPQGNLKARSGTIGGWTINNSSISAGSTTLSSTGSITTGNFSVTAGGSMSCTSGTIGGWTIGTSSLKGGNMYLNNNGSCGGSKWSITAGGDAYFGSIYGTVKSGSSLTAGGSTFSGGSGGTTNLPSAFQIGGQSNKTYIENLVVNQLSACNITFDTSSGGRLHARSGFFRYIFIVEGNTTYGGVTGDFDDVVKLRLKSGLVVGIIYNGGSGKSGSTYGL